MALISRDISIYMNGFTKKIHKIGFKCMALKGGRHKSNWGDGTFDNWVSCVDFNEKYLPVGTFMQNAIYNTVNYCYIAIINLINHIHS